MMALLRLAFMYSAVVLAHSHDDSNQVPIQGPHKQLWYSTLPGDGGTQVRRFK